MKNYQLLNNKFWKIEVPSECGLHFYVTAVDFSLNYDNNSVFFNVSLKPYHLYPNDLNDFYRQVINKNGWKRIEIDYIKYGKTKTRYLGLFLKNMCENLNKPLKDIEITLMVNGIAYSKYKLIDIKSYKYKSINDYYYDFSFEQI